MKNSKQPCFTCRRAREIVRAVIPTRLLRQKKGSVPPKKEQK